VRRCVYSCNGFSIYSSIVDRYLVLVYTRWYYIQKFIGAGGGGGIKSTRFLVGVTVGTPMAGLTGCGKR